MGCGISPTGVDILRVEKGGSIGGVLDLTASSSVCKALHNNSQRLVVVVMERDLVPVPRCVLDDARQGLFEVPARVRMMLS